VTVSRPHHPLRGQRVEVVHVRRGADPDLIVRLPDGRHAAIAQSWTTEPDRPAAECPAAATSLLAADGLRELAALVARLRERGPAANEAAASTSRTVP
jgi:Family of unknown function (DUF5372)